MSIKSSINYLDYTAETRDGITIHFEFAHDSAPRNRGFVTDTVNAFIDDIKVGYIDVEYIGSDRFQSFYPHLVNYITQMCGMNLLPYERCTSDPMSENAETLNKIIENMGYYHLYSAAIQVNTFAEFEAWFNVQLKTSKQLKSLSDEFIEFQERIDNPFVQYIRTTENRTRDLLGDHAMKGIGTALYKVMAIELAKREMPLRSSTLQTNLASSIWNKFEEAGWTKTVGDRLILLPEHFESEMVQTRSNAY